jgi:diguanylate cyclase (GGDEF)-like protein
MTDNRLRQYRESALAMIAGDYRVEFPVGVLDEVGRLGEVLNRLPRQIEARIEDALLIERVGTALNRGLLLSEVLDAIYDAFKPVIPYDRMGCSLIEKNGTAARAVWSRTENQDVHLKVGYTAKLNGSSLQRVIDTGEPRIINDLEAYLQAHPASNSTQLIVREGLRSSLTCPLLVFGKAVGFLFFSSRATDTYRDIHQALFLRLASQVSAVIERSRMYQQIHDLNEELRSTQDSLRTQAMRDPLTDLLNRRAITEILGKQISRARRQASSIATVMADIDHFKRINDQHGHHIGDAVLKEVALRLGKSVRQGDFVGRLGGEEFLIVLLPGTQVEASVVAERMRNAVGEAPVHTEVGHIEVTLSLGVAIASQFGSAADTVLINAADSALYRAKNGGRNQVVIIHCA